MISLSNFKLTEDSMDIIFLLEAMIVLLETIFLCAAIYFAIKGIKTKQWGKTGTFLLLYLIVNFVRKKLGL